MGKSAWSSEIENIRLEQVDKEGVIQKQKRKARDHALNLLKKAPKWGLCDSVEYREVKNALRSINKVLAQEPSEENVFKLIDVHQRLGYACRNYILQRKGTQTENGQYRLKLVDAVLKLQKMETDNVNHLRNKEHYMEAVEAGQGGTWEDYLGTIRKKRANVQESDIIYHGKSMNQRLEVKLGEETVFFTKERCVEGIDSYVKRFAQEIPDTEFKSIFTKEQQELEKKSALNREFIMQFNFRAQRYLKLSSAEKDKNKILNHAFNKMLKKHPHIFSEEFIEGVRSRENATTFFEFTNGYRRCYLEETALMSLNLPLGSNLLSRNIATRRIAELLGIAELVVKAGPMELTIGGKVYHGVYMNKAEGIDVYAPGGEQRLVQAVNDRNPSFQKALSGLQLLDAICGQVDRHVGNMIYSVQEQDGKQRLIGVQGIDNHLCFGKKNCMMGNHKYLIDNNGKVAFITKRAIADAIPAVDKRVAENIMALNKSVLNYAVGDILDAEEIGYLNMRVNYVKSVVGPKLKDKEVLEYDSDWTEEIAERAESYNLVNYLGMFKEYQEKLKEKVRFNSHNREGDFKTKRRKNPESDLSKSSTFVKERILPRKKRRV